MMSVIIASWTFKEKSVFATLLLRYLYDEFVLYYFIYAIFRCSDFVLLNFVSADIATLQAAAFKNLFNLYSFPVALSQIYFVLVLISTNHNARYLYLEMDISWTVKSYKITS